MARLTGSPPLLLNEIATHNGTNNMERFQRFANTVSANAANYKTVQVARSQLTRLNNLFLATGSYGCLNDLRLAAIEAIQDRCLSK